ncbi:MAG: isoleucine--tRNA ligase [Actinomycetota bacterium]|nr:isoleucine--tRNA ligase [Actinomycetota bacterium]
MPFEPLMQYPDHIALEEDVLAWWDREGVFDQLRERNRGGPTFSFMDGPITANNPMGAHHCWGRTLKDVFQRYKALRGFDQRYQNGFDCQGLWVEVGVERSLGLNSKREIEEYGLAEFNERCKERVAEFAEVITDQCRRLGMWMDWDNDYYTFSDTNIEYIWRFLKECHARGWLYKGHRSVEWCPRCGTSLSQHELINSYGELTHPSLYVRFPIKGREGESLVVWTTTPWTLPANVAAAVKPDAEYGLTEEGDWWAVERNADAAFVRRVRGEELVGLEYEGPFDLLPAQEGVVHRVIPWDDVTLSEGTGIVHIAPGCGAEDFELSRVHDLPVLMPINESGVFYKAYGEFEGRSTEDVEKPVVVELERRGLLVEAGSIIHRYPICWRCATPLVFRIADDWLIRADEIRQPMLDANATVKWTPDFYSKRMDDWLRNMDDWNISRRRYFGLPLPFYPCDSCGRLTVIGSVAELRERATGGLDQLKELHRPWIDEVPIACDCGAEVRRVQEVGDAWLDAGIVPYSTLGWQNPEWKEHGYANGAAAGLTGADLPDHAYWEKWYPADWVSEMREQIRLWFYSQSFMSVTLTGRSPYKSVLTYEKLLDEHGREMHRSWGNSIDAAEALQNIGADVMRFMFCEQVPSQNLKFGYGPADEIKRRLLTLWNSVKFFVDYANIEGFQPGGEAPADLQPLDHWLLERTDQLVAEMTEAYERYWTPALIRSFDSFVDDLSNWYIRRSRRRFWDGDEVALWTLWHALVRSVQTIAPVMPFLADFLWRTLRAEAAPESVFLEPWPDVREADRGLLAEVAEVRRVVELGRQARGDAGLKLRQPLRRLVVQGAGPAQGHAGEIAEELRVKEVEFGPVEATELRVKPNLPVLGPKLGKELGAVGAALQAGEFEQLEGGGVRVSGHEFTADEVLVERGAREGWALAEDDTLTVAVTTELDDELRKEGRVYDLTHRLNTMRKEAGLALTDRIRVVVQESDADLLEYEDRIKDEVLATEIVVGTVTEPQITRA